jgi:hypothetical protein
MIGVVAGVNVTDRPTKQEPDMNYLPIPPASDDALSAAAPDLLAALRALCNYVEAGEVSQFGQRKLDAARAAIAKADGK